MKIYFANLFGAKGLEKYLKNSIDVLAAYPALNKNKKIEKPPFINNLFLDSGAFTKQSDSIKIEEYINFIKDNKQEIKVYANLDVLFNAPETWKNQKIMEKNNLKPLPVYHRGSSFVWLDRIVKKYDYIALGGVVAISTNKNLVFSFLDEAWQRILSIKPDIKVHGFGIHNIEVLKRYPWYSVDASSIHMQARYGGILTPYGYIKINPNVNSKEMEWQIKTPSVLKKIKTFIIKYGNEYSFEEASIQSTEGTLIRCAISIHFLLDTIKNIKHTPIVKQTKFF